MKTLVLVGVVTVVSSVSWCVAPPAHADWLPGKSRAIALGDSASPHAPVTGYAYGPSAQASLGVDLGLYRWRSQRAEWRLGGSALVALDCADKRRVLPDQTQRTVLEFGVAWSHTDSFGRTLEFATVLGHRSATTLDGFSLRDAYHHNDVPFGAGGNYLGSEVGWRMAIAPQWTLTSQIGVRLFTNLFPDLIGQTEASDLLADSLREGSEFELSSELGIRWAASAGAHPLARLYLDAIEPHDDQAKKLWLARMMVGVALPGDTLEILPFMIVDAGHGEGVLVNRTELRLAGGVRIYAR